MLFEHVLSTMSVAAASNPLGLAAAELSLAREKILEHRLVSEVAVLMLQRGVELDVLRSEYDANGYDVVLEAQGIIRHLQLKATVRGGARNSVNINMRLATKPSGCVLWMSYDPETLALTRLRWFGAGPGEPLPALGAKAVKHTKANALGEKSVRPGHRLLSGTAFRELPDLDAVADHLFGTPMGTATTLLVSQLRGRWGSKWRDKVSQALEISTFEDSAQLAHLIDGYLLEALLTQQLGTDWVDAIVGQLKIGVIPADVTSAWATLFRLHRADRMTTSIQPEPRPWLDQLARQTVELVRTQLLADN